MRELAKGLEFLFEASFHLIMIGIAVIVAILMIAFLGPIGLLLVCILGLLMLKD